MAGIRPGGYAPLLCAAAARIGIRQIDPAEDHRRRDRLALLRPAQTRAEGVTAKQREVSMPVTQTRRRLLAMLSMAGAASIVRTPQALGAEGPPETTSVRITKNTGICYAPQYVAEELLRDEGFTDIRYVE